MANGALDYWQGTAEPMTLTDRRQQELALKAVQARRLTDPLGAIGQRRSRDRIEREARLRRGMFAGALAVFAASFGIVAATGKPGYGAEPAESAEPAPPSGAAVAGLAPVPANVRIATEVPLPRPLSVAATAATAGSGERPAAGNRIVTSGDAAVSLPSPVSPAAAAIGVELASSFAAIEGAQQPRESAAQPGAQLRAAPTTGSIQLLPTPAPSAAAAGSQSSRTAAPAPVSTARPVEARAQQRPPQAPEQAAAPRPVQQQAPAPARTRRSHARTHSS